ncbi:hypothetical protein [Actinacidiphila rubida]|uniref:PH domain-containing protein n=1 Tax=Actinacidiphila rubida TaxID=310780 RepID=A0A1H8RJG2_9ACTN|nr:hypothetical protein [Actinacidiphila rubida]SEO66304.1 hypothetical protein SAMN05216267_103513 [Actinacidiphila rubida]
MTTDAADAGGERRAAFAGQGGAGQRLARLVSVLVVPCAVLVPGLLVREGVVGDGVILLAMVSPLLGVAALYAAVRAWQVELTGDGLLSGRTVSGRRTVDLQRLVRVRRIELRGRGRGTDRFLLTDAHGVRLAVGRLADGSRPDDAVAAAVRAAPAPVAVSPAAGERLREAAPRPSGEPRADRHGHAGTHAGPRGRTPGLRNALLLPVGGILLVALGIALAVVSLSVAGQG